MFPSVPDETVPVGDIVHVNCSGVGSYIRISWRFDNTMSCNRDSCDPDFLFYRENSTTLNSNNTNLQIDSTLSINTSKLNQQQEFYNIEYRVEQSIPSHLNLEGVDQTFFTNIRVNFRPPGKHACCN